MKKFGKHSLDCNSRKSLGTLMSFHSVVQAEARMEKRKRKKEKKKKKEAIMNVEGDWRGKMDFAEVGDDGYTGVHCILSLVF